MSGAWHPDPLGRYPMRYFDGAQWTANVTDGGGNTILDPLGTQPNPSGAVAGSGPSSDRGRPWLRFWARWVDAVVVGIPILIVMDAVLGFDTITYDTEGGFEFLVELGGTESIVLVLLFGLYEIGAVAVFGRTIGKWMCGVQVVEPGRTGPPGGLRAVVRYVAFCVYLIPLVGWVLWVVSAVKGFSDPRGETLHDKAARTLAVSSRS